MSKHTPVPWEIGEETRGADVDHEDGPHPASLEMEANARLIAAAPEYDDFARQVVPALRNWANMLADRTDELSKTIRHNCLIYAQDGAVAIAKAEGREQ